MKTSRAGLFLMEMEGWLSNAEWLDGGVNEVENGCKLNDFLETQFAPQRYGKKQYR
jgi:hypothetical protein